MILNRLEMTKLDITHFAKIFLKIYVTFLNDKKVTIIMIILYFEVQENIE